MNKNLFFIYLLLISVSANSQSVDFNYKSQDGLYCNPSTIQFSPIASGNPTGFAWNFGNGKQSNNPDPVVTYLDAGTYTVTLVVIYEQYAKEVSKTITVNPSFTPTINFDRNYICKPGVVNFTGFAEGSNISYTWDFGDGTGIIKTNTSPVAHDFSNYGQYIVKVKAIATTGCFAVANTTVSVRKFTINGSISPIQGCVPISAYFTASTHIPANSSVNSYTWDFKDGNTSTTMVNTASHAYNNAGTYLPVVTVTTTEGCVNSFQFDTIAFGSSPAGTRAWATKNTFCGSENIELYSKAPTANSYFWDFGDGDTATVKDTVVLHKFKSTGIKNVVVTPLYNGCQGTPATFSVNVIGVIASYDYSNTCSDKKTFAFKNISQGNPSSLTWNFGDGSPMLFTPSVNHTFPLQGSFPVTLSITDNITGCTDISTEIIYTAIPVVKNNDSAICRNGYTEFMIANNYNNPYATYLWNVLGNQGLPADTPHINAKGTQFGYFNNYVIIDNGEQYCADTVQLRHKILVRGPVAGFNAPDTICFNAGYNVTNNSKPFIVFDIINKGLWDFENNGTSYPFIQPQPYKFSNPGQYNVKLICQDINGCVDSIVKPVTVKESPFIRAIPGLDTLCAGQSLQMIAFHSDPITWSPSPIISCISCDTIFARPTSSTKFFVTATNKLNCSSTDSVSVKVYEPFTATVPVKEIYVCANESDTLKVDPSGKKITWLPANGLSMASNYNPVAFPANSTNYTATLTDSAGCFTSSVDIMVHVKSLPAVDAGPDKTYPYNGKFSLLPVYSKNAAQYYWSPSKDLSCNNCPSPEGMAKVTTKYSIQVVSDSGCVAKDSVNIFVSCNGANILLPNAFTPNNDNLNDFFYPVTSGIKTIDKFSVYNRYGKLVFEAKNIPPNARHMGWNGKVQHTDQSTSVYVYYIEAMCDVGEKVYAKGVVVLLK